MDFTQVKAIKALCVKRYSPFLLVLLLGVGLMLLPSKPAQSVSAPLQPAKSDGDSDLQSELSDLLSGLSGAGKVRVLLTQREGEQILYQCNENLSANDTSGCNSMQTVVVTDSARNQSGLIRQVNPPTYLGAVVLCQGADSPSVRLAVVEAVSNATGLPTNRISVLKMK